MDLKKFVLCLLSILGLVSVAFGSEESAGVDMMCSIGRKQSSYSTSNDETVAWYKSGNYWLNGIHSNDNNEHQQIRYCRPSKSLYRSRFDLQTFPYTNTMTITNEYENKWIRGCGGASGIYSISINKDNEFKVKCANINQDLQLSNCEWNEYYTNNFECPNNGIIRTMESISYFYNNKTNIKYKFECCQMVKSEISLVEMNCPRIEYYINDFDGYFLSGLYSKQDINTKDNNIFEWNYCTQEIFEGDRYNGYISNYTSDVTSYQDTWERKCSNGGIIKADSQHLNDKKDNKWTFECGELDSNKYKLDNCGYTGYLNSWNVNFKCPSNGIIRSIWSTYLNNTEDRLFKFECCNIAKAGNIDEISQMQLQLE